MTAPCVLFRTEGGPGIGLGHLQRCLALAAAVQRRGARCVFVTNGESATVQRVRSADVMACPLNGTGPGTSQDHAHTLATARAQGCRVVVVDSYRLDDAYLAALAEAGMAVVAIDDLAARAFSCRLVVNGGAQASQLPYPTASGATRFLLGTSYALLHPSFWDVAPRAVRPRARRVLVTIGGSDPVSLTQRLVAAVDALDEDLEITAVLGPFVDAQEASFGGARHHVEVVRAPASLRSLMEAADVAISGGGQTVYELAATGTPTVSLEVWENQAGSLRAMVERGATVFGGRPADPQLDARVRQALGELMADEAARRRMSRAGQRLVDGQGALRVADSVMELA